MSRELILKDNVDFLVGTLTSAEGPAVSTIAKENKIVFIAPIPKTDQLTAAANLHPYVFRTASNTTIEGRTAAEIMAKWPDVKRIATIAPDYAYGQDVAKAFVEHIKKIKPDVEIVDQQWPKLGEADYTPFINAQMGKKPEAVFSALWGGHFLTFAKQAKPLGYLRRRQYNFIAGGEARLDRSSTRAMGADYPVGIWGNAYDAFNWEGSPPAHKEYIDARQGLHQGGPALVLADHRLHRHAVPGRGIKKANSTRRRQGGEGAARPHGRHADRQADDARQGPPGQPRPESGARR